MNIKKFTGKNMNEIMAQIQLEFGENAMIIQSKKVKKGGIFGFFAKEFLEVMAAVDHDLSAKSIPKKPVNKVNSEEFEKTGAYRKEFLKEVSRYKKTEEPVGQKKESNSKGDLEEIKLAVSQLNERFSKIYINEEEENRQSRKKEVIERLKALGISEDLSKFFVEKINNSENELNIKNLMTTISEKYDTMYLDETKTKIEKCNIFVGPTGVGKTTTIAKIASNIAINESKKIGFLTLDTYRIAAVEQLKTYAEILSAPLEVAYDKSDIPQAVSRLQNRDILFIDTAGRSHKNTISMEELKDVLESVPENRNVFLLIPANYHWEDVKNLLEKYSFLEDFQIVVTKLDETDRLGIILDIMDHCGKAPTFLTYGQNVPNDIEEFNFNKFLNELFMETGI